MVVLPILLALFTLCAALFAALMLYRSHLTRHEVDTIYLDEHTDHDNEVEHDDIVRKVEKLRPFVKVTGITAAALLVGIIGVYVTSVLSNAHF